MSSIETEALNGTEKEHLISKLRLKRSREARRGDGGVQSDWAFIKGGNGT